MGKADSTDRGSARSDGVCLAVTVQVSQHVELVFQTNGLQSLRQSVREGRNNVRGMREMLFQSEELQSMWHSVKDANHFEAFEGRRRAALARGRRGPFRSVS